MTNFLFDAKTPTGNNPISHKINNCLNAPSGYFFLKSALSCIKISMEALAQALAQAQAEAQVASQVESQAEPLTEDQAEFQAESQAESLTESLT